MIKSSLFLLSFTESLFITNSTIQFKMKYPNLADLLDAAAPGIDHAKVLSYGCNCQFLDGRPLAAASSGHPVDPLDQETNSKLEKTQIMIVYKIVTDLDSHRPRSSRTQIVTGPGSSQIQIVTDLDRGKQRSSQI